MKKPSLSECSFIVGGQFELNRSGTMGVLTSDGRCERASVAWYSVDWGSATGGIADDGPVFGRCAEHVVHGFAGGRAVRRVSRDEAVILSVMGE